MKRTRFDEPIYFRLAVQRAVRKKYDELGPLSFAEAVTLTCFISLVVLWFFRCKS